MKKRELIRLFKTQAKLERKTLTIAPARHGTKISCGSHSLVLPNKSTEWYIPKAVLMHRLGLGS